MIIVKFRIAYNFVVGETNAHISTIRQRISNDFEALVQLKTDFQQYDKQYFMDILNDMRKPNGEVSFMESVPYDILHEAIVQACWARDKAILTNMENGYFLCERLQFRSRLDAHQTIVIRKSRFRQKGFKFYPRLLWSDSSIGESEAGKDKRWWERGNVKTNWPNDGVVDRDCTLTYRKRLNKFVLNWPYDLEKAIQIPHTAKMPTMEDEDWEDLVVTERLVSLDPGVRSLLVGTFRIVSLDPGVRSFMTFYSPSHGCGEFGTDAGTILFDLLVELDGIASNISKANNRAMRRRLRIKFARRSSTIQNMLKELHHSIASFLVENFDLIVLPKFDSKSMSLKGNRKISTKVVRKMMSLKHSQFRNILVDKAILKGKVVVTDVVEGGTSKSCCLCGWIDQNLQGKKVFVCRNSNCGLIIGRDNNGARGIFIRALLCGAISVVGIPPGMLLEIARQFYTVARSH